MISVVDQPVANQHVQGEALIREARRLRRRRWRIGFALVVLALAGVSAGLVFAASGGGRDAIATGRGSADGSAGRSAFGHAVLRDDGIGSARFGETKAVAVANIENWLGKPNALGINTGCTPRFTEVAWHELIAEFRLNVFSGYRFIKGGWPVTVSGSPSDRVSGSAPTPPLETALGITLGSTIGQARSAYRGLSRSGAVQWTTANGLVLSESSFAAHPQSVSNVITEIQIGTCGAF